MIRVLLFGFALLATACGSKGPSSLCDNQVPAPAACNTPCDPTPGAANTCAAGYHCNPDRKCDAVCRPGDNRCGDGNMCTSDGECVPTGTFEGLQCQVTNCNSKNMPPTTISGTVFAPNGTLPLYGVTVYVPNKDPGPFKPGVQCGSCADGLPGNPIVQTKTDEQGHFTLPDVPNGTNIPVVITIGKWRRQIKVANVPACQTQQLAAVDTTLPKSRDDMTPNTTSVDMPLIAISTGSADSLECLVRRLGIADKEITTDAQGGRIHLFSDTKATVTNPSPSGVGTSRFDTGFGGGTGAFSDSQTLWGTATDPGKLNNYDIVILSCESGQHSETKPQQALDHLKAYADLGGRVFLSHWHNIWVEGNTQTVRPASVKPAVWSSIATFSDNGNPASGTVFDDIIDEDQKHNPKGAAFASWMLNVQGSTKRGVVSLVPGTGRDTVEAFDFAKGNIKAEQWVTWTDGNGKMLPQMFQFTTPNEAAEDARCGKVVFSDMHVSGGPLAGAYPTSCGPATTLSAQEKALAFMFFDISSCVGVLQ